MSNFYKFNIPDTINFVKPEISEVLSRLSTDGWPRGWVPDLHEYITDEGWEFLEKIGMPYGAESQSTRMFTSMPDWQCRVHDDGHQVDGELKFLNPWSINFIWGGAQEADMMWYAKNDPDLQLWSPVRTVLGAIVSHYPPETVHEIQRVSYPIGIALVRVDIPHAVQNKDHEHPRYCISMRSDFIAKDVLKQDTMETWEQAVEYFKPHLIIPT